MAQRFPSFRVSLLIAYFAVVAAALVQFSVQLRAQEGEPSLRTAVIRANSPASADPFESLRSEVNQLRADLRRIVNSLGPHVAGKAGRIGDWQDGVSVSDEDVVIISLAFVDAYEVVDVVQTLLGAKGRVSVLRDANKLVVSGNSGAIERVVRTVDQLDRPSRQVRITAHFFQVAVADLQKLGIDSQESASGSSDSRVLRNGHALLAAIEELPDSRLLARPEVETVDGRQAMFRSVSEVPVQQLTQTSDGGTIGTTEFRESGITLTVTPRVSKSEVILEIQPELSVMTDIVEGQPVIARRSAATTIRVADGETVLLRGWRSLGDVIDGAESKKPDAELLMLIRAELKP